MMINVKIFIGFIFLALALKPIMAQDVSTRDTTYILDIAWSPDGTQIAAVGIHPSNQAEDRLSDTYGYLSVINTTTGDPTFIVDRPAPFTSVAWSPDGQYLALGSYDTTVLIVDITLGIHIATLRGHQATVTNVDWSPDGDYLVSSGNWDGKVILWDMNNFIELQTIQVGDPWDVAFSPDGQQVSVGSSIGLFRFPSHLEVDLSHGLASLSLYRISESYVGALAWNPDGSQIAFGNQTGLASSASIKIIDSVTGSLISTFSTTAEAIWGLAWNADNTLLASYDSDGYVRVWSLETGMQLEYFTSITNYSERLSFSPYGARLAFGNIISLDDAATSVIDETQISAVQIIIPDPSLDRLQSIAELCDAPLDFQSESRETIISQVDALDIPPACRADLLAVAHAIQK